MGLADTSSREGQAALADTVRRVVVIGAGTMGQQVAFQRAAHGFSVVLHDVSEGALEDA